MCLKIEVFLIPLLEQIIEPLFWVQVPPSLEADIYIWTTLLNYIFLDIQLSLCLYYPYEHIPFYQKSDVKCVSFAS